MLASESEPASAFISHLLTETASHYLFADFLNALDKEVLHL